MKDHNVITKDDFESLLAWLSPDREEAGEKYEKIRAGLVRFFYFKGCRDAEGLADETINRVTEKIQTLDLSAGNRPITIFYGFASKVYLEELKKEKLEVPFERDVAASSDLKDYSRFDCLEICLKSLPEEERGLAISYYAKEKSAKFEHRRQLAENLGINTGALQVRHHRIRKILRGCVENCMKANNR